MQDLIALPASLQPRSETGKNLYPANRLRGKCVVEEDPVRHAALMPGANPPVCMPHDPGQGPDAIIAGVADWMVFSDGVVTAQVRTEKLAGQRLRANQDPT